MNSELFRMIDFHPKAFSMWKGYDMSRFKSDLIAGIVVGIATKFDEMMRSSMKEKPLVRIIRMRRVPFIDSTGIHNLETLIKSSQKEGIQIVLSGVQPNVHQALEKSAIVNLIGEKNICDHISKAVVLANHIARDYNALPEWRRRGLNPV